MGGVVGSSSEGEGEGNVKSKATSATRADMMAVVVVL